MTQRLAIDDAIIARVRPVADAMGVSVDALAADLLSAMAEAHADPGVADEALLNIVARYERAAGRHRPLRADIYVGHRRP
ncbi:MAG: hypothetical protein ACXIVL_08185 [Oceanicaulis sp.]